MYGALDAGSLLPACSIVIGSVVCQSQRCSTKSCCINNIICIHEFDLMISRWMSLLRYLVIDVHEGQGYIRQAIDRGWNREVSFLYSCVELMTHFLGIW